jgi:hypothetical protein
MNLIRLRQAEEAFLYRYPGGFNNPEIIAIRKKKHNVDKMIAFAQQSFAKRNFSLSDRVIQNMEKLVSRSSLISVFEKPRFRDLMETLSPENQNLSRRGLGTHFTEMSKSASSHFRFVEKPELAKWSLMTVCQAYFHPHQDVLVKTTTIKASLNISD